MAIPGLRHILKMIGRKQPTPPGQKGRLQALVKRDPVPKGKLGTGSRGKTISKSDGEEFLYEGKVLPVSSSNWRFIKYILDKAELWVQYKGGSAYAYSNVSKDEAISLLRASSKGIWGWDVLRVRGSKTAHKKPFREISVFA